MIITNKKNVGITIKAIDIKDEKNVCRVSKKPKQLYSTMKRENDIFFIVDKNNIDLPRLYENIKNLAKLQTKNFNFDLNSFLNIFNNEDKNFYIILNLLISSSFYDTPPFSLKTKKPTEIEINYEIESKFDKFFKEASILREAHVFCRYLQDMPSNMLNPETFVNYVTKLFSSVKNVKIKVLNKKNIKDEKMGLLLGVNFGSVIDPKVIIIEYLNNKESKDVYSYIGKGITFDAGGMNIKTMNNMRHMKFDMSGAAIVISTIYALAKNNVKTNVVSIAALTENLVSPNALRPDDVIISHSGKSVEIDNTDAEGRLILADMLSYSVKTFNPTKLIDVATLTGAMIFSLGDVYSGAWVTNDNDWEKIKKIAFNAGEYIWRLPFHENFKKPLESKIADITNSSSDRRAGSSRAACFLKEFTNNVDYIHLDVACTADVDNIGQAVMIRTLYLFALDQ